MTESTPESYLLSEEELRVLRPAMARARRGEYADESAVSELLDQPWH